MAFMDDVWLREQLAVLAIKSHKKPHELAGIAGISKTAYYDRVRHPDDFRRGELRRLDSYAKRFGLSLFMEGNS